MVLVQGLPIALARRRLLMLPLPLAALLTLSPVLTIRLGDLVQLIQINLARSLRVILHNTLSNQITIRLGDLVQFLVLLLPL